MKKPSATKRGRKAGGDILKALDPAGPALANVKALAFGQDAGNKVADMVRVWRSMELEAERLALDKGRIDAASYRKRKATLDAWLSFEQRRFALAASLNLRCHRAGWFRKVADAIESEFDGMGQDKYPLHSAAMLLLGRLATTGGHVMGNAALSQEARYTISQACKILEDNGHGPTRQAGEDWPEDWKRTVRRVCHENGIPIAPTRPARTG